MADYFNYLFFVVGALKDKKIETPVPGLSNINIGSQCNISYSLLESFIKTKGTWIYEPNFLNVVFLRGITPDPEGYATKTFTLNDNAIDKYNDVMVLAWVDNLGVKTIHCSLSTTEPGKQATEQPENLEGAAHLINGEYKMYWWWQTRTDKPSRWVLNAGSTKFWRDKNKDFVQGQDEQQQEKNIGQFVHYMGTEDSIYNWSAGCIGPKGGINGEGWTLLLSRNKFIDKNNIDQGSTSTNPFYINVWDGKDYFIHVGATNA